MSVNPMKDRYANFGQLARNEKRGQDFRVRSRARAAVTVVVAPHGGGIEPGTSEIAEAIAGADLSFYAFEGTKARDNRRLHITSTNFDEPCCLALVAASERVVTIHGANSDRPVVMLGGRDKATAQRLSKSLQLRGFRVKTGASRLQGRYATNICNRGTLGAGVQIEISNGLRLAFFRTLVTRVGRQTKTKHFWDFVAAVRRVIA